MISERIAVKRLSYFFLLAGLLCSMGCNPNSAKIQVAIMTKLESGSIVGSSEFNAGKLFLEDHKTTNIDLIPFNDDWKAEKAVEAYQEVRAKGIPILITSHVSSCALAIKDQLNPHLCNRRHDRCLDRPG